MNAAISQPRNQQGSMLLEALIAILIFSMGILAIVGMQAVSIKNVADSKYRMDAAYLASQLIGQMWADDKSNAAVLQGNYNSPNGVKYLVWLPEVQAALPGAATNPPTVLIDANRMATVTIRWQAPGETGNPHSYTAVAQFNTSTN